MELFQTVRVISRVSIRLLSMFYVLIWRCHSKQLQASDLGSRLCRYSGWTPSLPDAFPVFVSVIAILRFLALKRVTKLGWGVLLAKIFFSFFLTVMLCSFLTVPFEFATSIAAIDWVLIEIWVFLFVFFPSNHLNSDHFASRLFFLMSSLSMVLIHFCRLAWSKEARSFFPFSIVWFWIYSYNIFDSSLQPGI